MELNYEMKNLLVKIYERLTQEDFDPLELLFLNYSTDFKKNIKDFVENYSNGVLYWSGARFKIDVRYSFREEKDVERAIDVIENVLWDYLEESKNE